jgi:hypothetical protein
MDLFGNITRFAGSVYNQASDAVKSVMPQMSQISSKVAVTPTSNIHRPNIPANVEQLHDGLSTYKMSDMSGGAIDQMPRTSASALTGNYSVETGDPTLSNTDVVEINAKQGRGLAQYTNARRGPYDRARLEYIAAGGDPNDMDFQMQYAADEYAGKYDPAPGKSLSGFTGTLSGETHDMTVPKAATHFRKDFFRPSVPHNDRRIDAAQEVDSLIQQRDQRLQDLSQSSGLNNTGLYIVGERGRDGRYWGGNDYGWQSPASYKKLIGY